MPQKDSKCVCWWTWRGHYDKECLWALWAESPDYQQAQECGNLSPPTTRNWIPPTIWVSWESDCPQETLDENSDCLITWCLAYDTTAWAEETDSYFQSPQNHWNPEIISLSCFKLPSLWEFALGAVENEYISYFCLFTQGYWIPIILPSLFCSLISFSFLLDHSHQYMKYFFHLKTNETVDYILLQLLLYSTNLHEY